jgi:hypothetical protein
MGDTTMLAVCLAAIAAAVGLCVAWRRWPQ